MTSRPHVIRPSSSAGVCVALGVASGLVACSPSPSPTGPAPQIKVVYSAVNQAPSPVWVAQEIGLFKKNGVEVIYLALLSGGTRTVRALVDGEAQVGVVAASAVVEAKATRADLVMIIGLENTLNYDLVVRPGITKGRDLRGKRLGVSGSSGSSVTATRYMLREFLKLDPEKDVTLLAIGNEESRLAALQARQIDGTVLTDDIAARSKKAGLVSLIHLADKGIPYQSTGVAISRGFADGNPQAVRAFVKSVIQAIAYHKDEKNRDAVIAILGKYLQTGDASYLEHAYTTMARTILSPVPSVSEAGVRFVIAESKLANDTGLTVSDVVNNAFVKEWVDNGFIAGLYGSGKSP